MQWSKEFATAIAAFNPVVVLAGVVELRLFFRKMMWLDAMAEKKRLRREIRQTIEAGLDPGEAERQLRSVEPHLVVAVVSTTAFLAVWALFMLLVGGTLAALLYLGGEAPGMSADTAYARLGVGVFALLFAVPVYLLKVAIEALVQGRSTRQALRTYAARPTQTDRQPEASQEAPQLVHPRAGDAGDTTELAEDARAALSRLRGQ